MSHRPMVLFGGKGGVGKSTCSAALAAWCASEGMRSLVLTSDMTPSLSDILGQEIGDALRGIGENLEAIEISQESIVRRWKEKFGQDFRDILSNLVDIDALDAESQHQLLDYIGSAPSLREETMLDLIVDLAEGGRYDRIIWDTAPAGETLNLLEMPRFIRKHLRAGAKVFEGLDRIGKQLAGKRSIAGIMDQWIENSERLSRYVHGRSAFVVVANPEAVVVRHAERLLRSLRDAGIHIHGLAINKVTPGGQQERHVSELRGLAGGLPVAVLPLETGEVRGREALREMGEALSRQLGL